MLIVTKKQGCKILADLLLVSTRKCIYRRSFASRAIPPPYLSLLPGSFLELSSYSEGMEERNLLLLSREEVMALPASERWIRIKGQVEVIYSDEHVVVCNKPSGLLSVPGITVKDSLVTRVAVEFGQDRIDKMVVHRLDQATSGLLVFARTDEALRILHEDFRLRRIRKRYVAIVNGNLTSDSGEVDAPIRKDMNHPPLQLIDNVQGKPSLTLWSVISRDFARNCTRVELTPVTGRSHQLRLHMKIIGHPILGDELYAEQEAKEKAPRCLLHAQELAFKHPITGEHLSFKIEPDF